MNEIVTCKSYRMLNMSLSTLFGKTPKIDYTCGCCGGFNSTRLSVQSVRIGRPYTQCKLCGTINKIPIILTHGGDDYDD